MDCTFFTCNPCRFFSLLFCQKCDGNKFFKFLNHFFITWSFWFHSLNLFLLYKNNKEGLTFQQVPQKKEYLNGIRYPLMES